MDTLVEEYLHAHSQIENRQKKLNQFVIDIPRSSFQTANNELVLLNEYFLKNDSIYISKHPRFADYPEHQHQFLELNYVYSGTSHQVINGTPETIQQGELLLLDMGSTHSLNYHDENDILINIIFPNQKMNLEWLSSLNRRNSILFDFLAQTITERSKKQYLIFRSADNHHFQSIIRNMIEKYYTDMTFANEIITMYIPILFTELIGNCSYDYHHAGKSSQENDAIVIEILKHIEKDYKTITLEKLGKIIGYNQNYLSNLIKQKTGVTFSHLLRERRMQVAKYVIENTTLSISQAIEFVGLHNRSHFYEQFKQTFSCLPGELRAQKKDGKPQ